MMLTMDISDISKKPAPFQPRNTRRSRGPLQLETSVCRCKSCGAFFGESMGNSDHSGIPLENIGLLVDSLGFHGKFHGKYWNVGEILGKSWWIHWDFGDFGETEMVSNPMHRGVPADGELGKT